jgi:hypothetical protein
MVAGISDDERAPIPIRLDPISTESTEAELDFLRPLAEGDVEENRESTSFDLLLYPVRSTLGRGVEKRQSAPTASVV